MVIHAGVEGICIKCPGRLGGVEMLRPRGHRDGQMPLHTLRADVDYGLYEARTIFGRTGIKMWIYEGNVAGIRAERAARKAARNSAPAGCQRSGRRPGYGEDRGGHPECDRRRRAEAAQASTEAAPEASNAGA